MNCLTRCLVAVVLCGGSSCAGIARAVEPAPAGASTAERPLAAPADGQPFRGDLVSADVSWLLSFQDGGPLRRIAAGELTLWGTFVEPRRGVQIVLAGGGIIACSAPTIEREQLRGEWPLFDALSLPLGSIAGIVFRPPLDPAAGDQLMSRVVGQSATDDRVLLDNGDELTGTVAGLDDKLLRLQTNAGTLDVEVDKLTAVIFNSVLLDKPAPNGLRAIVGFRDGSRVTAVSIAADANVAQLKLPGGAELKLPTRAIIALQPLGGRVVYLSDLKPASYRHIPYLDLSWPYRTDRSVLGGQLRWGGHVYVKGLGMHTPARITYDLDQPYRKFQADAAIDAEAGGRGSAVFRVFTDDGSGSWQPRAATETVRGGEAPVPILVDLAGAKRISLLVDFADHGDVLDHADWLNARLVR